MIKSGKSRFWVVAAIIVGATVNLASGQPLPDWSYTYTDDYNDFKVENDSFYHSIFWPQRAFPPSEPYLYYKDTGELGFGDFHNQPAQLVYRFPFTQHSNKTISGQIQLDVHFPYTNPNPGSLQYSLSSDGIVWSSKKPLAEGMNIIEVESVRGICYITFYGIEVLIDNLQVVLNSYPADFFVKQGTILFPEFEFPTIQAAIEHAQDGNSIEVAPGTYTGAGNTEIDFQGKAITVYSKMGPKQTIIDCQNSNRAFYFHNAEEPNSVLRGFTIKRGTKAGSGIPSEYGSWTQSSAYPIGGGIYCEFSNPSIVDCAIQQCSTELGGGIGLVGAAPFITDCIVQYCSASASGAGMALIRDSNAVIINSVIQNNSGGFYSKGAGLYCYQSKLQLSNCEIRSNGATTITNATVAGGGIYAAGAYTELDLQKCLIADNRALSGAGIDANSINVQYVYNPVLGIVPITCIVRITNCTIANNKHILPEAVTVGGVNSGKSDTVIKNSIIWGNQGQNVFLDDSIYTPLIFYSDVQGGYEGQGNINAEPNFAPGVEDYHLQSNYNHGRYDPILGMWVTDILRSPCIDAGDPQEQVGPEPYPNGKHINMGAYGGTTQASKSYSPRIIHVATRNTTGSDYHSGTSKEDAFAKIQDAVNNANNGDVIMVWPGTYNEEVFFKGKAITIQSADEPAVVTANLGGYAFSFNAGESTDSVLRNIIITNCNGDLGGAITCSYSFPTLTNLTIVNNSFGISTFYDGSQPSVTNCIFRNNMYGDYEIHDPFIVRSISYCCLSTLTSLEDKKSNFIADPLFANESGGDFHLKSQYGRYLSGLWVNDKANSLCIDKGDPSMGTAREPRPNGWRVNIGAYGGTPFASKSSY